MPDWLRSVIEGDPNAAVGTALSAGERDRLQSILSRNKNNKVVTMKYQDVITEALKKKPMLFSEILGQTGIASKSLYNVLAHMKRENLVTTERADGESLKVKYALIKPDARPATSEPAPQLPAKAPQAEKASKLTKHQAPAVPATIPIFGKGGKFMIERDAQQLSVIVTALGMVDLKTGEEVKISAAEVAAARPIVALKAEVYQTISL